MRSFALRGALGGQAKDSTFGWPVGLKLFRVSTADRISIALGVEVVRFKSFLTANSAARRGQPRLIASRTNRSTSPVKRGSNR